VQAVEEADQVEAVLGVVGGRCGGEGSRGRRRRLRRRSARGGDRLLVRVLGDWRNDWRNAASETAGALERIRREWRQRLAGLALDQDGVDVADYAPEIIEGRPSIRPHKRNWLHVHVRKFRAGIGPDCER
jgi:hypothetical protein